MTEETTRYYAQQASNYERIHKQSFEQEGVQAIIKTLRDTFSGKRVYEVACGTGRWTQHIARVAKEVYAIDLNEEMLELSRAREYPSDVVTFARADAYAFKTNTMKFNGGLVGFWLSHVDRKRMTEFLKAFHSWLSTDAVVIMFDDLQTLDRQSASRTDKHGNRFEIRTLPNGERFEIIENFFTRDRLLTLIQPFGTDLQYSEMGSKWVMRYFVK
jgi:demethylmenaquinone methyltransferase/2-methoxy-6-polyprenyl-1,4-benzoquinol methylase